MIQRIYGTLIGLFVLVGLGLMFWQPPPRTVALDQGWTAADLKHWYEGNQGSRMIPLAWLQALEQPDGSGMFLDKRHMASFRYLDAKGPLPVGFVVDTQDDRNLPRTALRWKPGQGTTEPWVGMTCSACHTTEITYQGARLRVEGGATLADFQSFREALVAALGRTVNEPDEFDAFADQVLGSKATAPQRAQLMRAASALYSYHAKIEAMDATWIRYGYGRLDAVGHIYNKTAFVAQPDNPTANPSDAPVSYPFLWNIGQHTKVEWNGVGTNTPIRLVQVFDPGALGRNMGEVTGVFGDVAAPDATHPRYRISHRIESLVALEQQIDRLRPPRWPRELFPIDAGRAAEGKAIYAAKCAGCHVDLKRTDLKTRKRPDGRPLEQIDYFQPQKAGEGQTDTDPWMACNAAMAASDTGAMRGQKKAKTGVLGPRALNAEMLESMIVTMLMERVPQLAAAGAQSLTVFRAQSEIDHSVVRPLRGAARGHAHAPVVRTPDPEGDVSPQVQADHAARLAACKVAAGGAASYQSLGYKARPLTGVWATAPYLHNGSVPTLYDLLLPAAQRPSVFRVGSTEFDPKKVGYVTEPNAKNTFVFRVRDAAGAAIPGNGNEGHDFGASTFTEDQRLALLEYLKVAGE